MSDRVYGQTDQEFARLLLKAGIDIECVYDIGASNGVWSWLIAQVVPQARFELFEPHDSEQYAKRLAEILTEHPDFRMHRVALGDQETTLKLSLHENHGGASLIEYDWEGVLSKKLVPVRRLDSIVAELKLPLADVIKMDTQGFELKIMQGGEATFRHAKALFIETWLYRGYGPETPLLGEIIEWLEPRGFSLVSIGDPWVAPDLKLTAIDGYFLRTDVAERVRESGVPLMV